MNATVTAIQWTYHIRKDNTAPIKLRIGSKSNSRYYPISYNGQTLSLSATDWSAIKTKSRLSKAEKAIRDHVQKCETEARELCSRLTLGGKRPFSFDQFEQEFSADRATSFFAIFDKYLAGLLAEERIGTHRTYNCARVAFAKFAKPTLETHEVTVTFLRAFERHLLADLKLSRNTVAIYMRTIRVIYNAAALREPQLIQHHPFANKKNDKTRYQIRTAEGTKGEALSLSDLKRFAGLEFAPDTQEWRAQQFWILSLYCQGMNFKDIALLTASNILSDRLRYVRHKTKNTELHERPIEVSMTDVVKRTIDALRPASCDSQYVFGIVSESMDPGRMEVVIMQFVKVTNKYLKRICQNNGLPKITTYWARHSYASMLKDSGQSIDVIKELLGHSSARTTETYLRKLSVARTHDINATLQATIHQTDSQGVANSKLVD